jgi:N utilization substance protein A
VGIRGVRIQTIVRELHDEKIDVIEWNPDANVFIAKAISPARVSGVFLNEHSENGKTATVVVPEDQLSLAIGRDGQNARLAAKLTGWRIDIKSLPEAAGDALGKLQSDESLAELAEIESENSTRIEDMLARKAEGKPLTPEEYDLMARFVDRVERRTIAQMEPEQKAIEQGLTTELRQIIPAELYDRNILDSGLPEHVAYILQEAGYSTVGELAMQSKRNPDAIFKLQGIGPKAMQEIDALMESVLNPVEPPVEAEAAVESAELVETPLVPEVTLPVVEEIPVEISAIEPVVEETVKPVKKEVEEEEEEEEGEISFEELFSLKTALEQSRGSAEGETAETDADKKAKKKGSKYVEIEYDPDRDLTIARKKHKRGGGEEWES